MDRSTEIRRVLMERTTVHDYAAVDIDPAVVQRALEAALAAPNHRMTEPWRFLVVGRQSREVLLQISLELKG
ncbi:MAG TPA: nitroreductase family protein, partial [Polyangiaceae bacterium]|nr:nitroreductase family protein [Polyangiaceae bacterium]